MKIKFLFLLFFAAYFSHSTVMAQDSCGSIKSAQDILDCALRNHPEIKTSESSLKRDEMLKSIAKQLPNPELDSSILSGQPGTPQGIYVDVSLSQTIELGGKRKNRIKQALATEQFTKAQVLESKELTALNTVLALHRLRQIRTELAAIKIRVGNGKCSPIEEKRLVSFGITNVSMKIIVPTPVNPMSAGYAIAVRTLEKTSSCFWR